MMRIKTLLLVITIFIVSIPGCGKTNQRNRNSSEPVKEELTDAKRIELLNEILIATEEQKFDKVFKLTKILAESGGMKEQYLLGSMYRKGVGTEVSNKLAYDWYMKSAEQEYPKAIHAIGTMYYLGLHVKQDYKEAFKWYKKSAAYSYVKSEYNIGVLYFEGYGVDKNYDEAMKWFQKAAAKEYPEAMYQIGNMYLRGKGVEMNYNKAQFWLEKSAATGFLPAVNLLKKY